MNDQSGKNRLRTAGYVLLCICSITASLALLIPAKARRRVLEINKAHVYKGMLIAELKGYSWSSANRSVVLAVKAGCPYCESSIPFYVRLAELERNHSLKAHVVVACPGFGDPFGSLWPSAQPRLQTVSHTELADLGIPVTPTIVVVSSHGGILDIWEGILSTKDEDELVRYLNQERSEKRRAGNER